MLAGDPDRGRRPPAALELPQAAVPRRPAPRPTPREPPDRPDRSAGLPGKPQPLLLRDRPGSRRLRDTRGPGHMRAEAGRPVGTPSRPPLAAAPSTAVPGPVRSLTEWDR